MATVEEQVPASAADWKWRVRVSLPRVRCIEESRCSHKDNKSIEQILLPLELLSIYQVSQSIDQNTSTTYTPQHRQNDRPARTRKQSHWIRHGVLHWS